MVQASICDELGVKTGWVLIHKFILFSFVDCGHRMSENIDA